MTAVESIETTGAQEIGFAATPQHDEALGDVLTITGGVYESHDVTALDTAIRQATAGLTRPLTLELTECEFFPSMAVGIVIAAMRAAERNHTELRLMAEPGTLAHRVLTICGVPVASR